MTASTPDELREIRRAVRELCDRFPGEYWRSLEPDRYPEEFVQALTDHGWLAALIPRSTAVPTWGSPRRASSSRR